ncbi:MULTISPECIES: YggT family protein [Treponema]|uniref:YggT family protein n=1 Tax=Treponema rectale TaxID=744512 RepID=A0A840SGM2_9SPIR|nr:MULTISPECIES: YggT family protein [Treponema]MBB5218562.1 YggT family protein [Treponema rectale]MBE6355183.1 YggT family protein [Treponema sp.]
MSIFRFLAALVNLYTILCFAYIILTWIPGIGYNGAVRFLSRVCSPYLNFFKKFRFLIIAGFDFTPALGLCLLGAASSVLNSMSQFRAFRPGLLLALLISSIWAVLSSILIFLIIMLIVRLVIVFLKGESARSDSPILTQLDYQISKIIYMFSKPFSFGRTLRYRTALITAIIVLVLMNITGGIIITLLTGILSTF